MENQTDQRYSKDLEELSILKEKARSYKPQFRTPVSFFRTILSLSLFIIIFVIAFSIAFQKEQEEKTRKGQEYVPNANIVLP